MVIDWIGGRKVADIAKAALGVVAITGVRGGEEDCLRGESLAAAEILGIEFNIGSSFRDKMMEIKAGGIEALA